MAERMPASRPTSHPASRCTAAAKQRLKRSNPPVHLLRAKAFASKSEALRAEAALKKLDHTETVASALGCPPIRPDSDRPASEHQQNSKPPDTTGAVVVICSNS